jgi:hypothetical protein
VRELSLHILDLVENAAAADAKHVTIEIEENPAADRLRLVVADDGRGMSPQLAAGATDAYTTTRSARDVGLGLALLAAAAEQAGGSVGVVSAPDRGTTVTADFQLSHVDRAPLGSIEDTLAAIVVLHPEVVVAFRHRGPDGSYELALAQASAPGRLDDERQRIGAAVRRGRSGIGSLA